MLYRAPNFILAAMFRALTRNRRFRDLLANVVNKCQALVDDLLEAAQARTAEAAAIARLPRFGRSEAKRYGEQV